MSLSCSTLRQGVYRSILSCFPPHLWSRLGRDKHRRFRRRPAAHFAPLGPWWQSPSARTPGRNAGGMFGIPLDLVGSHWMGERGWNWWCLGLLKTRSGVLVSQNEYLKAIRVFRALDWPSARVDPFYRHGKHWQWLHQLDLVLKILDMFLGQNCTPKVSKCTISVSIIMLTRMFWFKVPYIYIHILFDPVNGVNIQVFLLQNPLWYLRKILATTYLTVPSSSCVVSSTSCTGRRRRRLRLLRPNSVEFGWAFHPFMGI